MLPVFAQAAAPVIDDSDNFAIIEDEQAAVNRSASTKYEQESKYDERAISSDDDQLPLAIDDNKQPLTNDLKLTVQILALQKELRELRGQLEVQGHTIKLLQQQQLTFYKDLNTRIKSPAAASAIQPPTPVAPQASTTVNRPIAENTFVVNKKPISQGSFNPADEQISYLAAYEMVKNKRFDEALSAMQNFVVQYPNGGYTANAHYWLGELYMVKNNYSKAIMQFTEVLDHFPASSKTAAANLKMGYALAASGKKTEAIMRLQQVINKFPDTAAAQLAAVKLDALHVS